MYLMFSPQVLKTRLAINFAVLCRGPTAPTILELPAAMAALPSVVARVLERCSKTPAHLGTAAYTQLIPKFLQSKGYGGTGQEGKGHGVGCACTPRAMQRNVNVG